MNWADKTVKELRDRARELGITGRSKMRKVALIAAIQEAEEAAAAGLSGEAGAAEGVAASDAGGDAAEAEEVEAEAEPDSESAEPDSESAEPDSESIEPVAESDPESIEPVVESEAESDSESADSEPESESTDSEPESTDSEPESTEPESSEPAAEPGPAADAPRAAPLLQRVEARFREVAGAVAEAIDTLVHGAGDALHANLSVTPSPKAKPAEPAAPDATASTEPAAPEPAAPEVPAHPHANAEPLLPELELGELPQTYERAAVRLLARDPSTLLVTWSFDAAARAALGGAPVGLRLYDVTGPARLVRSEDDVRGAWRWFLHNLTPDRRYQAALGRADGERFLVVLRSPRLDLPPEGASAVDDPVYAPPPPAEAPAAPVVSEDARPELGFRPVTGVSTWSEKEHAQAVAPRGEAGAPAASAPASSGPAPAPIALGERPAPTPPALPSSDMTPWKTR